MGLYADRVQETTTTTGTGTITLAGAVSGFRTFTSAFTTGARVHYVIAGGTEWEVGEGELATTTTLTRNVIFASSNSGNAVNFSAGTKNVFCDLPAQSIADLALSIAIGARRHGV